VPLPLASIPPTFVLSDQAPSRTGVRTLAIALLDDDGALVLGPGAAELIEDAGLDLLDLLEPLQPSTRAGDVTTLSVPGFLVHVVGVGDGGSTALRRAGAAMARNAKGSTEVASSVQAVADAEGLTAFVAGAVLASFRFSMRSEESGDPALARIVLASGPAVPTEVLDRAVAIARASWEARRLATVPSNIKSPAWLADEAVRLGVAGGLKTRVWDEHQLEQEGFGGIVAVGRASASPPRLVQIDYVPAKARRAPHVVLVGKGITFDTGGLSIKPGEAMANMKRDMTGSAVVVATMSALRAVGAPVRVTGLLPIAENSIGGDALRPGDVIRHWGGRTTEVTNTDAEGRLVLADALQYAASQLKPDLLVDVATLTGAMKVALGLNIGGYFANDEGIARHLEQASAESGERLWRMPLAEDYESLLDSRVADADNSSNRAQAITAALFLQHFTGDLPWAHLDLASVGDSLRENFEWTSGPTGFGARLLLHWLGSAAPLEGVGR
jgi:leucyl aminopeptidase